MKKFASLEKGLDILSSFFNIENETLTAQAISERLSMPLSTTYRYIQALESKGFLDKEPDSKKYRLGLTFLQLGKIVASQRKLADIVMPHMVSLRSQTKETVMLTVIKGFEAVCLEKIDAGRLVKVSPQLGSNLPLHAGASSKILLAYQEETFVDFLVQNVGLKRFTESTITDPVLLKRELRKIREQGFAFSDQEVDFGAKAVSAPVFDRKAKLTAGIAVAGPRERITKQIKKRFAKMVKDTAKRASDDLALYDPN
jgi:DNA-binding IclR family transcriptional regulator